MSRTISTKIDIFSMYAMTIYDLSTFSISSWNKIQYNNNIKYEIEIRTFLLVSQLAKGKWYNPKPK